jgi:phosphoribosyl 1,2-cyclic phosphate phosphodiesterase
MLGSGTSSGVPRIGNDWGDCDPNNPRNRRSRVSIIVESGCFAILVDTSPDLRSQCLACDIRSLDAVIWTHDHADHCHGIDDLRAFFHQRREPVAGYARTATLASLQSRFGYAFAGNRYYPAIVAGQVLTDSQSIGPMHVQVVDQPHGAITSAGLCFRAGGRTLCYATDFDSITAEMIACFQGCDLLIVDALREAPHPTHAHLDMAIELSRTCAAKQTVLTHMDKSMDYATLTATLPAGIAPGYDGLVISL